jgi:hypothetical protein
VWQGHPDKLWSDRTTAMGNSWQALIFNVCYSIGFVHGNIWHFHHPLHPQGCSSLFYTWQSSFLVSDIRFSWLFSSEFRWPFVPSIRITAFRTGNNIFYARKELQMDLDFVAFQFSMVFDLRIIYW